MERSQIDENSKQNSGLFSLNDQKEEKIPNRYFLLIYGFACEESFQTSSVFAQTSRARAHS